MLDDDSVRCWGSAANGQLGLCNANTIGDDETPGLVGPIVLQAPGPPCPTLTSTIPAPPNGSGSPVAVPTPTPSPNSRPLDPLAVEALRARGLRTCLARTRRQAKSKRARARAACRRRHGRTPGRVTRLKARALRTKIVLSFNAPGSDGARPPAARTYLVKQSRTPIRGARDFARGRALCRGSCGFEVTLVGTRNKLSVTGLRPHTRYYYAIAARDNVTGRTGPRSTVRSKTRPRS